MANADPIRMIVSSRSKGAFPGDRDYWCERVDATLDGYCDWDGTVLMLQAMIQYVGPMLAGDFVRVAVIRDGRVVFSFRGRPEYRGDRRLQMPDRF